MVTAGGVNTTDQELYGVRYSGYVWGNVTELGWFGLFARGHAIEVRMEVRSSNGQDRISLNSGGQVKVTIYGSREAQAEWMDLSSLRIGEVGIESLKNKGFKVDRRDVDKDGWSDLVVYFSISELVRCGELTAISQMLELDGCLLDAYGGLSIRGCGTVLIPPGQNR
jgi:hypothetical protein